VVSVLTRFKLGTTAKPIHKDLCDAWSEGYVSCPTAAEWVQRFGQGRTSLEDGPRMGQPITETTDRYIDVISALIQENPHIRIRYMMFETGLSHN
jgi:HTH domain in Mos1 transposase